MSVTSSSITFGWADNSNNESGFKIYKWAGSSGFIYHDQVGDREYLNWSRQWISAVHRVLKSDGTFWLAIGDEYAAELKLLSQEIGFHCRSWVVWYYTFGVNCKAKFTRSHAHLFHFVKDPENFTFHDQELDNRVPSARELVYNDKRANPLGRLPDDTWISRPADVAGELTSDDDGSWSPSRLGLPSDTDRTFALRP
ncbi:MAG: site-specific DNA-methyltransferase, partial [Fuerstiella sp.]|nr:site-specific DNA-methyltransferase [Fuerstiella sp.]